MPLRYQYPEHYTQRPDWEKMCEQTENVCKALMLYGLDISKEQTPEAVAEVKRRVEMNEAVNGVFLARNRRSVTAEVIISHWGIETNVSVLSPSAWDKKFKKLSKTK